MLTLLLVTGGLTVMALATVVMSLALRRAEEQDRQTRYTDPHAAYWGRPQPRPTRPRRGRHAAPHRPYWARTNHTDRSTP